MKPINTMRLEFPACPQNESFARVVVSAFTVQLNPTLDVIADIKTAVSEAVTNAIVHAYGGQDGPVTLFAALLPDGMLEVTVEDRGCGIADVAQAMRPFFTTQPDQERSGMGFAVMQTFMDEVRVRSAVNEGTSVRMRKRITAPD